jgi:hypothetical protein
MPWGNLTTVANDGRVGIQAASQDIDSSFRLLLQTRDRGDDHEISEEAPKLREKAGEALRKWANITEQKLAAVGTSFSKDWNVIEIEEAEALWLFLDQIGLDVSRYVQDPDSVLEGYEPLERAAAPSALKEFWERYRAIFDGIGAYKDTLAIYRVTFREQAISEVRRYEQDRREDSRDIRTRMGAFMNVAVPLMQAIAKLVTATGSTT